MHDAFHIFTLTHRQTKLANLEHFVLQDGEETEKQAHLHQLKAQFGIQELMYLATCNRVMYFFFKNEPLSPTFKSDFLRAVNPATPDTTIESLQDLILHYQGGAAIRHLFEVSASIDSMVVGEREILRQVRQAYDACRQQELTGDNLRLTMKHVVEAAKEVYAQTRIGEKPVSVVSLAIQQLLAAEVRKDARILMIGAGETNGLVAKFLIKHGFGNVSVYNRSLDRALQLADKFGGKGLPLNMISKHQDSFDCMIVCTGATKAIVDVALYQQLLHGETDKKVVIDLAIPNNVSKGVVEQFNLNYIEIEGLRNLASANINFRMNEVTQARQILHKNLQAFKEAYRQRHIELAMRVVPKEIKAVKAHAMNHVFKKDLEALDDGTRDLLERMMDYMERQCISIPMKAAKGEVMGKKQKEAKPAR